MVRFVAVVGASREWKWTSIFVAVVSEFAKDEIKLGASHLTQVLLAMDTRNTAESVKYNDSCAYKIQEPALNGSRPLADCQATPPIPKLSPCYSPSISAYHGRTWCC
uniref:Uncharacterized protein n=1 Tax=Oryza punctata TaxID=4537 RepID=A0A0E0L145_ORYPU